MREVSRGGGNGRYLGVMNAVHAITPETTRSCHYFSATTRDFRGRRRAMTEELHEMGIGVGTQNVALNAIEQELEHQDRLPLEVSVPADSPALQIRRMVEDMIARELDT